MRLWHKDLIPYLPKQQLLGQWRELNSIYKLQNRHVLINFVYDDYPMVHLFCYSSLVTGEMINRGYKVNLKNYIDYFSKYSLSVLNYNELYKYKMNDRYLKQCLYNLQEKHDCRAIPDNEWEVISEHFNIY